MHHRGNHYSQPKVVRNKFIVNSPGPCPCSCDDCQRRNRVRTNQLVVNPQLKTNARIDLQQSIEEVVRNARGALQQSIASALKSSARGDDGDRRQMIADLISNDDSPFTPDDEEALRYMPDKTLREMSRQYLKANSHTPTAVANRSGPALKAMSAGGIAGADFAREQEQRRQRSLEYCQRNPSRQAYVANSSDPAARAMSEHAGGAVAFFQREGE